MATLRRAHCYRWKDRANTRTSNNPAASYITGVPGIKITHFDMGDPNGEYAIETKLISTQQIQIRHNALEAARQSSNRYLEKELGKKEYHFKILTYPHHIMRENKMATGAGADRVQEGMRKSFGKPVGKAARVKEGQTIMRVRSKEDTEEVVKEALRLASMKLPCKTKTEVKRLKEKTEEE